MKKQTQRKLIYLLFLIMSSVLFASCSHTSIIEDNYGRTITVILTAIFDVIVYWGAVALIIYLFALFLYKISTDFKRAILFLLAIVPVVAAIVLIAFLGVKFFSGRHEGDVVSLLNAVYLSVFKFSNLTYSISVIILLVLVLFILIIVISETIKNSNKLKYNKGQEVIDFLLSASEKGALKYLNRNIKQLNVSSENNTTPLYVAAAKGYNNLIRFLFEHYVKVNAKTNQGVTPLYIAVQKRKFNSVSLLLKHGASPHMAESNNGDTPLTVAASEHGDHKIVELLIKKKCDINYRNNDGNTALIFAAHNNYLPLAQLLIKNGADINSTNYENGTALFAASQAGNRKMVQLLLNNNADKSISLSNGTTPLEIAKEKKFRKIIKLLNDTEKPKKTDKRQLTDTVSVELFGTHSDVNFVKEYLRNLAQKAKDKGVYSIWSWIDSESGKTYYEFISNISVSNDFEFGNQGHITQKTMLYENGTMRAAGRDLVDGPDWNK